MKNATEASDRTVLLVAGLTAAALGLGFFELGKASIWLDEAVSATLAQVPFGEFAREAAAKEANMSLYYVLLRPFLWLGNSEIAVRLPSVLAFAATIPLLHRIGTRIAGPRVGGGAATLYTVNGFVIHYTHQARGYTLAAFMVSLAGLLLLRVIERPTRGRWLAYAAAAGLGIYVHFFVGLVLLVHALVLAVTRTALRNVRALLPGATIFAGLTAPLMLFLRSQEGGQIAWIPRTTLRTVIPTFKDLTGLGGKPLLAAYFLISAAGLYGVLRMRAGDRWKGAFALLWVAIPAALAFIVSLWIPIVRSQYLIVTVPGLALLAAIGLTTLPAVARRVATITLVALALAAIPGVYRTLETHDWRGAAQYVRARDVAGDGVVFVVYYGWTPYSFYARPSDPGTAIYPDARWTPNVVKEEPLQDAIDRITARKRVWLILNNARTDRPDPPLATLLERLRTQYRVADHAAFYGGVRVTLFVQR